MFRRAARLKPSFTLDHNPMRMAGSFYMNQMYEAWLKDPNSVHTSWRTHFGSMDSNSLSEIGSDFSGVDIREETKMAMKIGFLYKAFQIHGHMLANLDPLQLQSLVDDHGVDLRVPGSIRLDNYAFSDEDMNKTYDLSNHMITGYTSLAGPKEGKWKLNEFIEKLRKSYCSNVGFEFVHIPFRDETN